MASNPYVNKVQKADGSVIIDISDTTAVDSDVASGKYFYASNGQKKIGTGANVFVVNLSYDSTEEKWLPDCTFSTLESAYNAGKNIVFEAPGSTYSDVQISGQCFINEDTGNFTCWYYVVVYDYDSYSASCQMYYFYLWDAYGITADAPSFYWDTTSASADDSKVLLGETYFGRNGKSTGTYELPAPTIQSLTVTPTTSQQVFNSSSVDGYKPVTVNAIPSGTAGTPTAAKGTVSNHQVTVTPSVVNTTGYITGGTKTGTPVTVTASELASGSVTIYRNGTDFDVVGYSTVNVAIPSANGVRF